MVLQRFVGKRADVRDFGVDVGLRFPWVLWFWGVELGCGFVDLLDLDSIPVAFCFRISEIWGWFGLICWWLLWIGVDLGCDFFDFGDLGSIWVVIFVISVIWGRFGWWFLWFRGFGVDLGCNYWFGGGHAGPPGPPPGPILRWFNYGLGAKWTKNINRRIVKSILEDFIGMLTMY